MGKVAFITVLWAIGMVSAARGQDPVPPDTVKLVRVNDTLRVFSDTTTFFHPGAVIVGSRAARQRSASTVQRLRLASIERTDASSVSDVLRIIPSAHVQTNSRGETQLYLRNSGERQLAIYFDGALLNIPWDNRVDLDLIPASALAGVTVSKGPAPSEFGPNLMGGAVNLISRDLGSPGMFSEATVHAGSGGERLVEAMHIGRTASFSYLAAVGYVDRDGITIPDDADLPFSQPNDALRTNTDLERLNVLGRGEYTFDSGLAVSLAAMAIDAEKGIAPEGHKDPLAGDVRYWRYPDWRNRLFIASLGRPVSTERRIGFQTSAWINGFEQRIVAYETDAFATPISEERDDDLSVGGRAIVTADFDEVGVRLSAGVSQATHDQVDIDYQNSLDGTFTIVGPEQEYRQLLINGGIEGDYRLGRAVYTAGMNLDARSVQEAHVFTEPGDQLDLGLRGGVIYELRSDLELRAAVGRRSRFPTLREQFSGALGRFVVNPDLKSENAILSEAAVRYGADGLMLEATAFVTITSNTIDQTNVFLNGSPQRMRINLDGSRNVGLELNAAYNLSTSITATLDATLSRLRAADPATGDYDRRLTERPERTLAVRVNYLNASGLSGSLESVYTGEAYSLDDLGGFARLSPSTAFNARAGYRLLLGVSRQSTAEVFVRVRNIGDTVVENQLGLPGPGRTAMAGIKVSV